MHTKQAMAWANDVMQAGLAVVGQRVLAIELTPDDQAVLTLKLDGGALTLVAGIGTTPDDRLPVLLLDWQQGAAP